MIAYKYKLYRTDRTKHLDKMLREACFVWNHALAMQKRYYRLYGKYINTNRMQKHFAKRISRNLLHSHCCSSGSTHGSLCLSLPVFYISVVVSSTTILFWWFHFYIIF